MKISSSKKQSIEMPKNDIKVIYKAPRSVINAYQQVPPRGKLLLQQIAIEQQKFLLREDHKQLQLHYPQYPDNEQGLLKQARLRSRNFRIFIVVAHRTYPRALKRKYASPIKVSCLLHSEEMSIQIIQTCQNFQNIRQLDPFIQKQGLNIHDRPEDETATPELYIKLNNFWMNGVSFKACPAVAHAMEEPPSTPVAKPSTKQGNLLKDIRQYRLQSYKFVQASLIRGEGISLNSDL